MKVISLSVCPNSEQWAAELGVIVYRLSVCPNSEQEVGEFGMMDTSL